MKFGCCAGIERLPALQRMGFDYIELNLSQLSSLPQEEYMGWRQAIDNSGLYAEAFNCMLPGGCALVGPGRDLGKIRQLLEVGFARAAQLGGKIAVLGSGGARRIPENMDAARAQEQLLEAVDAIGAGKRPMRCAGAVVPKRNQRYQFGGRGLPFGAVDKPAECARIGGSVSYVSRRRRCGASKGGGYITGARAYCQSRGPLLSRAAGYISVSCLFWRVKQNCLQQPC